MIPQVCADTTFEDTFHYAQTGGAFRDFASQIGLADDSPGMIEAIPTKTILMYVRLVYSSSTGHHVNRKRHTIEERQAEFYIKKNKRCVDISKAIS